MLEHAKSETLCKTLYGECKELMYNVLIRPDEGFQKHWCPICKTEYDCIAAFGDYGCDDEDFERDCHNCLGVIIGVDFDRHIKVKNVKEQFPTRQSQETVENG